jgi:DNA-binding CsgD family transcriptional regulator
MFTVVLIVRRIFYIKTINNHFNIENAEDLATKFEFLKYIPGYILIKNKESCYQAASKDFIRILGWNDSDDIVGKTDHQIPSNASEAADLFIEVDKKVIDLNRKVTSVEICNFSPGVRSVLVQKRPLKTQNNITLGVICQSIDITDFFLKKYKWLNQIDRKFASNLELPKQYILTPEASPLPISPRQQECLSLLVRGQQTKEIACILGISPRTVESHFELIKRKLGCYNKSQLIEKAIANGLLYHIPETLFSFPGLFKL